MRGIFPYLFGFVAVFLVAYYGLLVPSNVRFILTPENLQIRGDLFFGRTIPRSALDIEQARLIPAEGDGSLKGVLRMNGVGLPNYQSGWFRTNLGRSLLFRRPATQAVAIPVKGAYTLIVTPADPRQFLLALRTPQTDLTEPLAS
jgi:hypothetical protein